MSAFLSFLSIPGLKLSTVLLTVLLSELMTIHSIHQTLTVYQDIVVLPTKSPDWTLDHTFDWVLDSIIYCIATSYIMTNCIKIQHNFLRYYKLYWINSKAYISYFTV